MQGFCGRAAEYIALQVEFPCMTGAYKFIVKTVIADQAAQMGTYP